MKRLLLLVLLLTWSLPALAAQEKVYFFNWSEYLPEAVLEQFTAETGIEVVYSTYDSNEAMYAKLKLAGGGYDLAIPSTYFVNKMRREGLLHKIDHSLLKNFANLDPARLNQAFDPGNEYSIPYLWGSTGIAVNAAEIDPAEVQSWADLWKPEFKGKLLLTNDLREVFHLGLRVLGYSGNSTDPAELQKAYEKLIALMPNVRLFNSDSPKVPYLAGEVSVGMIWNGEAYMAGQEDPNIKYIYPKEGAALWMDSLVIPKDAKNVGNALKLIDFLLRPEIAKLISEEIGYASPNRSAIALLDAATRNNRTIYPQAADLVNAEFQLDVGEAITTYETYWEKLKTGH